jgi:hypothetical protein
MAISDPWVDSIYHACSRSTFSSHESADPVRGVGTAELFRLKHDFQESKERIGLIAKRALVTAGHDVDSFVQADPLLDKATVRIVYTKADGNHTIDARVEDAGDVEQLEKYRVHKALVDRITRAWPRQDDSGCSVQ